MHPLSNFVVTTAPATEPIEVDEAKLHLRVDINDDDFLIQSLITAAREHVEAVTGRALVTRSMDCYRDQFPGVPPYPRSAVIELPKPPLASITSFQFVDSAATTHTWTVSGSNLLNELGTINAHIDTANEPGRIILAYSQVWPSNILKTANALKIGITAGYGSAGSVPLRFRSAMLLLIGHWYENRESVRFATMREALPLPMGVDMLLAPLKNWCFA